MSIWDFKTVFFLSEYFFKNFIVDFYQVRENTLPNLNYNCS